MAATAITSSAQVFTTLANFAGVNGSNPFAGVVQATNGNFYGTTQYSGAKQFRYGLQNHPAGKLITMYSFCAQSNCTDGLHPSASLIQTTNGNFYGTTQYGGAIGGGTFFKITPTGTLTTLYRPPSSTRQLAQV